MVFYNNLGSTTTTIQQDNKWRHCRTREIAELHNGIDGVVTHNYLLTSGGQWQTAGTWPEDQRFGEAQNRASTMTGGLTGGGRSDGGISDRVTLGKRRMKKEEVQN